MKIIEGFETAKTVLSRQGAGELVDEREPAVRSIIDDVCRRGDEALLEYTLKFDGVKLNSLEVSREQITAARQRVDSKLLSALTLAAERIRAFHLAEKKSLPGEIVKAGSRCRIRPLERVGVYTPGGTASYPSTVLMTAIPAKVAGVKEVILSTPPGANGEIPPLTLVAVDIAQVDRIFSIGGAQAIAALAFGTESVPRVDKICGPGNIYVMLAKKMVYGVVGIDGLQGPSEVLIIADETASAEYCAADLLAQAEHDPMASAILVTTSRRLAGEVNREIERQLKSLTRQAIANKSLESRGIIALVDNIDEAIELANLYAPEHLCLMIKEAANYVDRISNAGCVFVGEQSTVALGDYVAGPSHVLPTGGTARFSSPLNVSDFLKLTNIVTADEATLPELGQAAQTIASAEGLDAHAYAIARRLKALVKEGSEMSEKEGIERLIRPDLAAFGGYSAATSPETLAGKTEVPVESIIKLDANENPYGCSPRVRRALAEYSDFHIYPDDGQTRLRKLLERYTGVNTRHIVASGGSNQLIDLVLRLFLNPGDEVINCVPTFGIYRFSTAICGGTLIEVPRDENFAIDVKVVEAAITRKTKMIFLANPNNPSGNITPRPDILELLDTGLPVLVDEAYYEFSGHTVAPLVSQYENLMVLRTFSKWAGLAGLRIGYGLFPPKIAGYLLRIKMPYNVNVAALVAVQESLEDIDYLKGRVKDIIEERERLWEELRKLRWLKPIPSQANFILCEVLKGDAKELKQKLQDKGVLVRYFSQPRLQDYIRISVGKPEQTDALIKVLKEMGKGL